MTTRGILLCAHDNEIFWYGRMAYCCALMIREHMGKHNISVAIDTDTWDRLLESYPEATELLNPIIVSKPENPSVRNYRVEGIPTKGTYYNATRKSTYELTPYDETLVIDTDMLIFDDRLNMVWGSENVFMMNYQLSPLVLPMTHGLYSKRFEDMSSPIYWATVFYFKKSPGAKRFFDMVQHIAENFDYYGMVYGFPARLYRNDHTFSVAAHMMGGHTEGDTFVKPLPVPYLTFAWDKDYVIQLDKGSALVHVDGNEPPVTRVRSNIHCMNKSNYEAFADRLIELYA